MFWYVNEKSEFFFNNCVLCSRSGKVFDCVG